MDGTDGTSRDDDPVDWAQRFPADPELMTSPEGDAAGLAVARRTARERRGSAPGAAEVAAAARGAELDVRPAHLDRPRPDPSPPPVRPPAPSPPPVEPPPPPRPAPPDGLSDDLRAGDPDLLVDTVRGSSVPREPAPPVRDDRPAGREPRATDGA